MSQENGTNKSGIERFFDGFDRVVLPIESTLTVVCFAAMCIIVLYGVIGRFILKIPNPYGEEISRYLMIYAIYFAVAIGVRQKEHIRVDFFINALPKKAGKAVDMFGAVVSIAGYLLLTVLAVNMFMRMVASGQKAPSLRIPIYFIYIALVGGMGFSFLHAVEVFILDHFVKKPNDIEGEGK